MSSLRIGRTSSYCNGSIAGLPDDLAQTLELSTVQELNSAEIAEVMKIPEGSVRTRLFRARKQLKEKLTVLLEGRKHG